MRYLDADETAEAFEAYRQHIPLDQIAGRLQITVAELRQLLNLPSNKPAQQESDEFDLFACDRLDAVL